MVVIEVLMVFLNSVINFLPKLIAALILLGIGWLVGTVIGRVTKEVLVRIKVDHYLAKGKKPVLKLSDIFPVIFSWAVYLIFIQAAVQTLGVVTLVAVLDSILAFIPGLVKAILVVIAGYALAEYVRRHVEASKIAYSDIVGKALFILIIYVAIAMALPLVGIDPTLVNNLLLVIIGSIGLGIAIAIGLGLKDTIASMAKKKLR